MHVQFAIFAFLILNAKISLAQNGVKKCECVAVHKCFPDLQLGGDLDIRIVNGNRSTGPPPTTTTTTTTTPRPTLPPSPCANGLIQCCAECGIRYNITTTLKPTAGQGQYGSQPWQVLIFDNKLNYIGGGALLDEKNVLTAAHKIYAFRSTPTTLLVRLGEWDSSNRNTEPYEPQNSTVSKIFIHGQYSDAAKNLVDDIAILRLATPIRYGPTVNPAINTACIPTASMNFNNMRCFVSGWGKNAFNGSYQAILKEVDVPMVANTVCETRLKSTKLGSQFKLNTQSFICAGGEPGKDACVGDGGSPLMCQVGDKFQVVGLVAWGIGCANGNIPGVYVRVQNYLDFISGSMAAA